MYEQDENFSEAEDQADSDNDEGQAQAYQAPVPVAPAPAYRAPAPVAQNHQRNCCIRFFSAVTCGIDERDQRCLSISTTIAMLAHATTTAIAIAAAALCFKSDTSRRDAEIGILSGGMLTGLVFLTSVFQFAYLFAETFYQEYNLRRGLASVALSVGLTLFSGMVVAFQIVNAVALDEKPLTFDSCLVRDDQYPSLYSTNDFLAFFNMPAIPVLFTSGAVLFNAICGIVKGCQAGRRDNAENERLLDGEGHRYGFDA